MLPLDIKQKERHNSIESVMITSPRALPERRSKVSLTFACILVLSATPACAIQMVRIAELNEHLDGTYPCGDVTHNGRYALLGTGPLPRDSLVAYEYVGNDQFQRIVPGPVTEGAWEFGDGDNDGLMEVVGMPWAAGYATIWESRTPDSFPSESICTLCPGLGSLSYPHSKFIGLDRAGHQEIALAEGLTGIWVYENSGDNCYRLAAELSDSSPWGMPGDFDVGDFDCDSLPDLVTGNGVGKLKVYEAVGNDSFALAAVCTTGTEYNWNVASAHDMDHNGWPEFIAVGADSSGLPLMALVVCEVSGYHRYHQVWEQVRPDFNQGTWGNPISVGDVDGDQNEEFAVDGANGSIVLFKCTGLHTYEQVWAFNASGTYLRLFDINQDGRTEVIFDGTQGTEIWEDTEGLGVAEFSKFPLESQVMAKPSVARLGAFLLFSGIPPGADIEVLSLDGRLVSRTSGVRQSSWTWNLLNQSGSLVPAGTYFAVIRSKGKTTSLKLCLVK